MKKILLTLITAFSFLMTNAQTAPDFSFTDINGDTHTLSESLDAGKVVILDFFFVNCGPCQQWAPDIETLIGDYDETTVEVWSISDRDTDAAITASIFNPTHDNHKVGGSEGEGAAAVDLYASNFNFIGFPTFAVVCTDGSITWDVWPLTSGVPELRNLLTEDCGVADLATSVGSIEGLSGLKLAPNPASVTSKLEFELNSNTTMTIDIVNTLGQTVKTVAAGDFAAGLQTFDMDLSQLSNGLYFVRMLSADGVQSFELSVSK